MSEQLEPTEVNGGSRASSALVSDASVICRAIQLLYRRGEVAEIRIPKAGREGTISGYFNNSESLVKAALRLDGKGAGLYVTLNPVDPALLARAVNKVKVRADLTTSDQNILSRRWLLIDLDPKRPPGISSTDKEHKAALDRAQTITEALGNEGWPEPVIADSGNGGHLLYRIELRNDPASTDLISGCLTTISNRYSDKDVSVDLTVYNASRIIKLYGTVARKGDHTPERPHRLSRILQIPKSLKTVPQDLLEKVASEAAESAGAETETTGTGKTGGFPLEKWMQSHKLKVRRGPLPWSGRGQKWELEVCPFNDDHTDGCAVITRGNDGKLGFKCQHNSCFGMGWRALRGLLDGDQRGQYVAVERPFNEGTVISDWRAPIPFLQYNIAALPPTSLPGFLGDMVGATALATETPVELAALLGIAVVAASIAKKVVVCPEDGYMEPVNIFAAVAMESGNRKTAVLNRMASPFVEWEYSEARRLAPDVERIGSQRKTLEARIESLRKKVAVASDPAAAMAAITDLELSLPDVPKPTRLWAQDVTPEQLGVVMAAQRERIAVLSDEGGIFEVLAGRYSKGVPNLDLFLQAHSGSPVRVDRGSRPPVMLQNPALTVAISPQPDVLESLSDKPGFRGRGLLARFLYALPPSPLGFRRLNPTPCPQAVEVAYRQGIERLLKLSPATDGNGNWLPWRLRFSPRAYSVWKEFQRSVELLMREGNKLFYLKDWASKLSGAAVRLAGVLHCVNDDPSENNIIISEDTVEQTLNIVTPLIDHTLAVFNLMERNKGVDDAQKILAWIVKGNARNSVESSGSRVTHSKTPFSV